MTREQLIECINTGFGHKSSIIPTLWKQAERIMNDLCLGPYVRPLDFGPGMGKFTTTPALDAMKLDRDAEMAILADNYVSLGHKLSPSKTSRLGLYGMRDGELCEVKNSDVYALVILDAAGQPGEILCQGNKPPEVRRFGDGLSEARGLLRAMEGDGFELRRWTESNDDSSAMACFRGSRQHFGLFATTGSGRDRHLGMVQRFDREPAAEMEMARLRTLKSNLILALQDQQTSLTAPAPEPP